MKSTLERRILLFILLALSLTIAVNTGFNVESFRRSYRDGILKRCETLAVGLKQKVETVVNLGIPLSDINDLSERCQSIVQHDPEIAYCVIENASGDPLYHSNPPYPSTDNVKFIGQHSPDISILEGPTLGEMFDVATPLYDSNDVIVGRVRIGFQGAVLKELTLEHLGRSLVVLTGAFFFVFAIIVLFARFYLILPIKRLCGMASEISDGNFEASSPVMKTSELKMLADSLTEMAGSLHSRDLQIQENYNELEETNVALQTAYESLESISSELGRSREMYRSLLDDASDAILVCDENDDLILVNKIAESFFGLSRSKIEGKNYFSFLESIRCKNLEDFYESYHKLASGQPTQSEIRFWRIADQRQLLGWATSSAIVGKDGKRFVQIIVRDATQEEEIRINLEKTAKEMARLNQMKNSFLGLASHELKTPLTIILGYVELLQSEMLEQLDEQSLEMIRHIAKASERLSEIIRDMVDVSMLDGQTVELVSKPVDVNQMIRQAVDNVQLYVGQRHQHLHVGLADNLPVIRCDVPRMVQAFGNLLSNAIKFTPDSGHITVQTRTVEKPSIPKLFDPNGRAAKDLLRGTVASYVEITIADTGIGIAETDQMAIFEKFYEVGEVEEHSTGKVAFKSRGAGLGLTIAKGVIDLHGGTVWVESPGHDPEQLPGSTFYVLLPVDEA